MTAPLVHLYALALRTLDAHERRIGDLRARIAPVLAAGGVGTTLLAALAAGAITLGRGFASTGALHDEAAFYTAMIAALATAARRSEADFIVLQRQFTAVMCGILFVLCGLATAVLVA